MARPIASVWGLPLRWGAYFSNAAYIPIKYRVRGWGRLPRKRGPTLLISNHQHEMEAMTLVSRVGVTQSSWSDPIFSITSRRMHEPGFMAIRFPWLRRLLRRVNASPLFLALGLVPLENQLRTRPIVSLAWALQRRHGILPLNAIFDESVAGGFPLGTTTDDLYDAALWTAAHEEVTLRSLREPYRREILDETRQWVEEDLRALEDILRRGGTMYISPEGFYTTDGRIQRLRGVYDRLAPLATVYLAGVSYDPFVGKRLAMLFRILPLQRREHVREELAAIRPVTVSQLIGEWLYHHDDTAFTSAEAIAAVEGRLRDLPAMLFIDPPLRSRPAHRTERALTRLCDLGILNRGPGGYRVSGKRNDERFTSVPDILVHQANFLDESIAAANALRNVTLASLPEH